MRSIVFHVSETPPSLWKTNRFFGLIYQAEEGLFSTVEILEIKNRAFYPTLENSFRLIYEGERAFSAHAYATC